ncbi:MAG: 4-hydroxy-3-methylbut-2-enyl diphosphate reductase [Nitrospirae bacterium]|nr:4-hydroxy-3-methylbut-2-enyl diphosphate reductase [Nitrospirota bacterium]
MEIRIVKSAGFCFGVKRAVDMAFKAAEENKGQVCTYGPIIHNPQVVEKLKAAGVAPVDEIDSNVKNILIRTHGISYELHEDLKTKNINIIDATCPFVKKAQQYAKLLKQEGYQIIILGDEKHPEVVGIRSYAGQEAIVVKDPQQLPRLKTRVGVVVQTTQPVEALQRLLSEIIKTARELKVYNTICNSTANRLKETEALAKEVDVMLVIGGRNSANTNQLARRCEAIGVKTYHIESAEELAPEWFRGVKVVGVTAGASTPDWIIKEVIEKLKGFGS